MSTVTVQVAPGAVLEFLGYTFRYRPDRYGRVGRRYFTVEPSAGAVARLRTTPRALTTSWCAFRPVDEVVAAMNRVLVGWRQYFSLGRPGRRVPGGQRRCGAPHPLPFTPSESTALPSTGRDD